MTDTPHPPPVALITGAARRIGAAISRQLHSRGYRVVIHYHRSGDEALQLRDQLNRLRPDSAATVCANLSQDDSIEPLAEAAHGCFGRLDALVNNASSFYPTPIGSASLAQWDDLMNSNAKAPLFLSQALAPELRRRGGAIVNLADIHAERPLKEYTLYCMAKAANVMLTRSLARELAPEVRVNGIAPGAILWPEEEAELDSDARQSLLRRIPLGQLGAAEHIAQTVSFALENTYLTGQIIAVDGGRSVQD